jgi:uncharacterized protein
MKNEIVLRLLPSDAANDATLKGFLARELKVSEAKITGFYVRRRSIDARKHPVMVQLHVITWIDEPASSETAVEFEYPNVSAAREVLVVGAGPGGLFAALRLIELGL